jgi:hypothetical protein
MVEAEMVNPAIEIVADTPDRPGIGLDGLWLQTADVCQVASIMQIDK